LKHKKNSKNTIKKSKLLVSKKKSNVICVDKNIINDLKEKEERLSVLYESSLDAMAIIDSKTNKFISGNPATLKIFKIKNEKEFANTLPSDLSPKYQPNGLSSLKLANKKIKEALDKGVNTFEWKHKRQNGEEFWAFVVLVKVKIGGKYFVQVTIRDISGEKQTKEELKRSEERFRDISLSMGDWI
jgi:PAS domain S-box-containing protein